MTTGQPKPIVLCGPQAGAIPTFAPVNPRGFIAPLFVPTGGQARKHTPRPERQARNKQAEFMLE